MSQMVPHNGGGAVATYSDNPWADAAVGIASGQYLKFNGNDGIWSYGQDDTELVPGSSIVADMHSLAFGFICWVASSVEEEVLVPVVKGRPPAEADLTDHGPYDKDDGWREASSIAGVLESIGGDDQHPDVGLPLLWKTSTGGQVRQVRKLSGTYGRIFAQHPGQHPVVEIGAESYAPRDKKHGKIKWSPTLKIIGWITDAELASFAQEGSDGHDDGEPEPAPAATTPLPRRAVAPIADEPEVEVAAPARRRAVAPGAEEAAPVRRRTVAAAPLAEDDEPEAAPPPRRRAVAPVEPVEPVAEEPAEDENAAPEPRGRSAGRAAPPANARVRRFA